MATYNEFLAMNGHSNMGEAGLEMSNSQSLYGENLYSDETTPLLICTPTRGNTKSSILYVSRTVQKVEKSPIKGSRYFRRVQLVVTPDL